MLLTRSSLVCNLFCNPCRVERFRARVRVGWLTIVDVAQAPSTPSISGRPSRPSRVGTMSRSQFGRVTTKRTACNLHVHSLICMSCQICINLSNFVSWILLTEPVLGFGWFSQVFPVFSHNLRGCNVNFPAQISRKYRSACTCKWNCIQAWGVLVDSRNRHLALFHYLYFIQSF